jgi:glucose/arabinose dehydrogenase
MGPFPFPQCFTVISDGFGECMPLAHLGSSLLKKGSLVTLFYRFFVTSVGLGLFYLMLNFTSAQTGTGLKGEYFHNQNLTTLALTRTDANINFDWSTGRPAPGVDPETFSVRWTGQVVPLYTETYTFYTQTDDGARLWVNGQLVIDDWVNHGVTERSGTISLVAGQRYDIKLEYYDQHYHAVCRLLWSSARQAKQIVPQSQLFPTATGNSAPSVSITSPANGTSYTPPASITINASASDSDGTIAKVEFFNGGINVGEDLTAPYSFTLSNVSSGSYTLTARATDNAGATTTSAAVNVIVNALPSVSITSPASGASFSAPASITIQASASDSDGSVSKVEFFQGTTKLGEDTTSPYSYAWSNVPAGTYSLTARATDNLGGVRTSTAVSITVTGAATPPSVVITSPANGASFTAPATITINANATDTDGTVTSVEFFHGTTRIGEDVTAPFSVTWMDVAAGSYTLTARATDSQGLSTTSSPISVTVSAPSTSDGTGLKGEYFDNRDFTALKVTRIDANVNFDWGSSAPDPSMGPDLFSVRWTGTVKPRYSQTYTFYTVSDDGVRLWVNGVQVINNWTDHAPTENSGTITLTAGQQYEIKMEFYDSEYGAVARLLWSSASQPKEVIPKTQLYPPTSGSGSNSSPIMPTINEPRVEGMIVNPADVHMETEPMSDPNPGQTHVCTDWEIWRVSPLERVWYTACIGGLEKVHTHLGDGVFINSHAGRRELLYDTNYRLRVRFKDSSGDAATEWSPYAERNFRTSTQPPTGSPTSWTARQSGYVIEAVAGNLQLPVNIAFVPNPGTGLNDPLFYVTELYGAVKVVTRNGTVSDFATGLLNFNPTGNFPGSGEQGVAGICVDPNTGNLFVSMLYEAANGDHYPKVVRYTTHDGLSASSQQTILDMPGEPQGQSHQVSSLSIGPDGKLYVHMGDGFVSSTALDLNLYRGKILRMNLDGSPAADNPFYNAGDGINARDYIYAYGFRNPFGGSFRASDNSLYEVENGPSVDRFAKVVRGRSYGWNGAEETMANFATYNWSPANAPVNVAFIQQQTFGGSGFPQSKWDHAFVSTSGPTWATGPQPYGKKIVEFTLDSSGNRLAGPATLIEYTGTGKSTVAALAAGPDGLYFSELYNEFDFNSATSRGAKIYKVRYTGGTTEPPPPPPSSGNGLKGDYYDNRDFTALAVTRTDATVNFNWGGAAPASGMGADYFSVRWTGKVTPKYSETYTFYTQTDDGVRLWVNGQLIIDNWTDHGLTEDRGTITLTAGQQYDIRLEFYDSEYDAISILLWSSPSQAKEVIPQSQLSNP